MFISKSLRNPDNCSLSFLSTKVGQYLAKMYMICQFELVFNDHNSVALISSQYINIEIAYRPFYALNG